MGLQLVSRYIHLPMGLFFRYTLENSHSEPENHPTLEIRKNHLNQTFMTLGFKSFIFKGSIYPISLDPCVSKRGLFPPTHPNGFQRHRANGIQGGNTSTLPQKTIQKTESKQKGHLGNTMKLKNCHVRISKNRGTPKSSILIGFSIINHPFWGTIIFGNTHVMMVVPCHDGKLP